MKKLFTVAIILLFFGMIIFPSSGIQIEQTSRTLLHMGNTLYVGGSGTGNYSKIQDAIDNASDGDTVFVFDDSSPYYENILINKSINLIGEDKNTTVIDGNYIWVIQIYKDSVNFSGFTIIDADTGIRAGYYNLIISDNNFINCDVGIDIVVSGGDESYIISNSFSKNCVAILADCHLTDNQITISNNTIISSTENWYELADIYCWGGKNFVITNNTLICNYPNGWRVGIELDGVSSSIIEGNEISGYDVDAIYLHEESYNNIITHNNITNNDNGIFIGSIISSKSNSNKIINNNFINNKDDAVSWYLLDKTHLDGNYWDEWIGLKYKLPIFQRFPMITFGLFYFNIDWNPAKEPYDI